jgi:hypothetical protein
LGSLTRCRARRGDRCGRVGGSSIGVHRWVLGLTKKDGDLMWGFKHETCWVERSNILGIEIRI